MKEWLGFSKAAVDIVNALGEELDPKQRMWMLLEQNVKLQLQHLKTHPTVATRLAKRDLQLHGWVYDIASGEIHAYDEASDSFMPVAERYADYISQNGDRT